jgi:hypothetical protein
MHKKDLTERVEELSVLFVSYRNLEFEKMPANIENA